MRTVMRERLANGECLADTGIAIGWVAAGATIAIASWRMDRLAELHINPFSAPGLLPGLVGVLIALLGLVLLLRALHAPRTPVAQNAAAGSGPDEPDAAGPARPLFAVLLCVLFAGGLLGRGLPFVPVAAAFIFTFIVLLGRRELSRRPLALALIAALVAVSAAAALAFIFGDIFLVRLP